MSRLSSRYMTRLADAPGGEEGAQSGWPPDLSAAAVDQRVRRLREELNYVVEQDHGGAAEMRELVDRLAANGRHALSRLAADGAEADIDHPHLVAALEVIVREDGSRPAFQVVNGRPRPGANPADRWYQRLDRSSGVLQAIAAVGRINDPGATGAGYHGTGFLAGPDVVVTNRHVAQAIAPLVSADHVASGVVRVRPGIFFDHGHEFGGTESAGRRPIVEVVFTGSHYIDGIAPLDHTRLDLAVLRLGAPLNPASQPVTPLAVGLDTFLTDRQEEVVVIGYPARPSMAHVGLALDDAEQALALIYQNRFGYKRAAPGEIVRSPGSVPEDVKRWRIDHDASTLGGNSGSCVVDLEFAPRVSALHYGGEWFGGAASRLNWAHALRDTLDEPGLPGLKYRTMREAAENEGIALIHVQ